MSTLVAGYGAWASLIAQLLEQSSAGGTPRSTKGSQEHHFHHSTGGVTYRSNNKRSRDRAERRRGEISARQQRIHRKAAQRLGRNIVAAEQKAA